LPTGTVSRPLADQLLIAGVGTSGAVAELAAVRFMAAGVSTIAFSDVLKPAHLCVRRQRHFRDDNDRARGKLAACHDSCDALNACQAQHSWISLLYRF